MMMQDALPSVKSFFRFAEFTEHAQTFVVRMMNSRAFRVVRLTMGAMKPGPMARPLKQPTQRDRLSLQSSMA